MPRNSTAYDEDFFAWTAEQARLLRAGELPRIDSANIAEEIEDMGRSIRHELRSRLTVLTMHLLKWRYQPNHRSPSWSRTIAEQRDEIADLLLESPSLRAIVSDETNKIYRRAARKAAGDTGLPETAFPAECPFTATQILDEDFLPQD